MRMIREKCQTANAAILQIENTTLTSVFIGEVNAIPFISKNFLSRNRERRNSSQDKRSITQAFHRIPLA